MKNHLSFACIIAGLISASGAFAAANIPTGGPVTIEACPLLSENVTVNLSSNVQGAFSCNVDTGAIKVATCSEGGSRKVTTQACSVTPTPTDDDPDAVTWNDPSCSDSTPTFVTGTQGVGFFATSKGGQVAAKNMASACSDTSVANIDGLD